MKRLLSIMILAASVFAQTPGIVGNWQGTLDAGPVKLRLALHIMAADKGGFTSTLDSLDQNVSGIPVQETTFADNKLHLNLPTVRAQFDGTLNASGDEIAGTFTQGVPIALNLKRVDRIEMPSRPQEPKTPYPYDAVEASYENKGIHLAGTLTLPRGKGPFPAALMISGSGPQDRDESIMGHKPFWIVADYLTRRGIAILRVDDRGVGKSSGNSTQATLDDMASDVLAGIAYLKGRKEIDSKHIGVIGHSEGGMVGPLAAAGSSDVAFVVMLAGTGVSFQHAVDVHESQAEVIMRQAGASGEAIAWNSAVQNMIFRVLRSDSDANAAIRDMRAELEEMKANLPETQRRALNSPAAVAETNRQFASVTSPEMRSILLYDPAEALRKLKVPVLALNGSRDVQVLAKLNLPAITAALAEAGNSDFTVVELPGLNHLFQSCQKCTVAEYGELDQTFSPTALLVMGDWLVRHTRAEER
jgi:pimeloyl-ACP methyl ester carboxylesterase